MMSCTVETTMTRSGADRRTMTPSLTVATAAQTIARTTLRTVFENNGRDRKSRDVYGGLVPGLRVDIAGSTFRDNGNGGVTLSGADELVMERLAVRTQRGDERIRRRYVFHRLRSDGRLDPQLHVRGQCLDRRGRPPPER
jgi:hypothetical protein